MRFISIRNCKIGDELGRTIYNQKGGVLLNEGVPLNEALIKRLEQLKITHIYIKDELSEGIEVRETIPLTQRIEFERNIEEAFTLIQRENGKVLNLIHKTKLVPTFQKLAQDLYDILRTNDSAINLLTDIQLHDQYVFSHSLNVTIYAMQLAMHQPHMTEKDIRLLGLGALLHDIGKMLIPLEILQKKGPLTDEEFEVIKTHTELGFDILRKEYEIPLKVAHCAFQHHERLDGTGYPRQLKEPDIQPLVKYLSVADVFDALTSHRSYRKAMLPHKALRILYEGAGTQFDSNIVESFGENIAIYPIGLTVKLNTNETAIVSAYNYNVASRPKVRIIEDAEGQALSSPIEVDLSQEMSLDICDSDILL